MPVEVTYKAIKIRDPMFIDILVEDRGLCLVDQFWCQARQRIDQTGN